MSRVVNVKHSLHFSSFSSFPVWKTGDVANRSWKAGKLRTWRGKRNFVTLSSFQFCSSVFSTGKCECVFHAHEPEIVLWSSSVVFQIIRFCVTKTFLLQHWVQAYKINEFFLFYFSPLHFGVTNWYWYCNTEDGKAIALDKFTARLMPKKHNKLFSRD